MNSTKNVVQSALDRKVFYALKEANVMQRCDPQGQADVGTDVRQHI